MAFPYEEINTFARDHVRPRIVDSIFKSNVVTNRLMSKNRVRIDGGKTIRWATEYALANGGTYDGAYDVISTNYKQTHDYAELGWKFYYAYSVLTDKDKIMASGKEEIFNLVKTKFDGIRKKMVDQLGTGVYTASADADATINGLRQSIDTANTYGGIAQATYSWWQAAGENSTTTTLAPGTFTTAYVTTKDASNEEPTIWVTESTIFTAAINLFQPQQRFTGDNANVGFPSLVVLGKPLVMDNKCPTSHLFLLNENYLEFVISDKMDFEWMGWKNPINQPSADVGIMKLGCNMINLMPRAHYKCTAITG
jgi:hypothetical protein